MIKYVTLNINSPSKLKGAFVSEEMYWSPPENFGLLNFPCKLLGNYYKKYKKEEENIQKAAENAFSSAACADYL